MKDKDRYQVQRDYISRGNLDPLRIERHNLLLTMFDVCKDYKSK
jgi:hypothetical protein